MITIKCELTAGTDIETAFIEAISLASKLGCFIDFTFNDVHCTASPKSDYKKGAKQYRIAIRSTDKYKYAIS